MPLVDNREMRSPLLFQPQGQEPLACPITTHSAAAIGQAVTSTKKGWESTVPRAHGHEPVWTETGGLSAESRAALRQIDVNFRLET